MKVSKDKGLSNLRRPSSKVRLDAKIGLKIRFPLKECRFESDHRYQHLALIFRAIFLLIPPLSHPCPTLRKSAPVQAWPVAQGSGD
jgi:hypothetical protein